MKGAFQAVRGMNDQLPDDSRLWRHLESVFSQAANTYGYHRITTPIVEATGLFARTIGEHTDIVEKEMYTFDDRNGDSLALRPEGTAGCVRAVIEHALLYNQPVQRLWYSGPVFRHERPQKGRYRQFYQFGVEAFGLPGPDIDVEVILLAESIWRRLDIRASLRLEINSLGSSEARKKYRDILVDYFKAHQSALDEDSQRRLTTNPLRILDSKNPQMQDLIKNAPLLIDHLDDHSASQFKQLCEQLDALNIAYTINPHLVRGLDYYNGTVFEWVTDALGAQGTVCAGGRYDSLVELLGGQATPAIGFALGIERLLLLAQTTQALTPVDPFTVYVLSDDTAPAKAIAFACAEQIRQAQPGWQVIMHCGGGSFKSQFKRADKSAADVAVILGSEEVQQQTVSIKTLKVKQPQQTVAQSSLIEMLLTMPGAEK